LKYYKRSLITSDKVMYYMSPESGLYYGTRGGYGMSLLQNRENFISLNNEI